MSTHALLKNGFADPVFDSQSVFRALLDALARPGTVVTIALPAFVPPDGAPLAATASLIAMADYETPLWLAPELRNGDLQRWLSFYTGAPVTLDAGEARFAVLSGASPTPQLHAFAQGNDRYPDQSATLFIMCDDLEGGENITLSGPGIEDVVVIAPTGLHAGFWDDVRDNNAAFPLGVDIVLVAKDRLIGLPRSTRIVSSKEIA